MKTMIAFFVILLLNLTSLTSLAAASAVKNYQCDGFWIGNRQLFHATANLTFGERGETTPISVQLNGKTELTGTWKVEPGGFNFVIKPKGDDDKSDLLMRGQAQALTNTDTYEIQGFEMQVSNFNIHAVFECKLANETTR